MARPSRATILVLLTVLLAGFMAAVGNAGPARYQLDARASNVGFTFTMGGALQKGTMPVTTAKILINPADLSASRVDISLNVGGVRTPLPFARQALIGPDVLDSARYPTIRFVSSGIKLAPDGRLSGGARITGKLTVRGVTRPVTLDAGLFRAPGSAANDLSELSVHLKGQISRSAFGATGFGDLVADTVGLNIIAVLHAIK